MSVETATFRTKTGTCTITPEEIVLARTGLRGAAAERLVGRSVTPTLVVYGLLGLAFLAYGVRLLVGGAPFAGALFAGLGALALRAVIASRAHSAAPVIRRADVRGVEAHPPRPPLTRGYFVVTFVEGGRLRKRAIMLPGSAQGGGAEYARAAVAFQATGLLPA